MTAEEETGTEDTTHFVDVPPPSMPTTRRRGFEGDATIEGGARTDAAPIEVINQMTTSRI